MTTLAEEIIKKAENEQNNEISKLKSEYKEEEKDRKEFWEKEKEKEKEKKEKYLEDKRRELLANAKLEKKKIIAHAKEDVVQNILINVREEFKKIENTKEFFKKIDDVVKQVEKEIGEKVIIKVSKTSKYTSKKYEVKRELEEPGFIIESKDGRIAYTFRLSELIDYYKDEIRTIIYKELKF